jgi:hypothetical protein
MKWLIVLAVVLSLLASSRVRAEVTLQPEDYTAMAKIYPEKCRLKLPPKLAEKVKPPPWRRMDETMLAMQMAFNAYGAERWCKLASDRFSQ